MQIRAMTYNIKAGRYHPDGLEAVARVIEAQSPDVLGLQEVDEHKARTNFIAQADWLTRRLRMRGLFAPAMAEDGGFYGVALLSRWPIRAHERKELFRPVYTDAASRPHHDSEQRVALGTIVSPLAPYGRDDGGEGGHSLKVMVTHLGLTADQRMVQVQEVADFAQSWRGSHPTLVMGDFNCDPDASELAPLRKRFQEACAVCSVQGDARYTFPSGLLGARTADGWRSAIDYVWASPDLKIVSARVLMDESQASDHQPLSVEFELSVV
jgi:endonuclease/exonuclease/phosphatase family metal-dependent hydrolase